MMWMRLVVPILMILSAAPAWATRYWVSTSGNDANSCASVSGAADPGVYRLTPQNGAACLRVAGDRLTIKAGTYTGSNATIRETEISVANGTPGNPTIIEGVGSVGCALKSTCLTKLKPSTSRAATLESASYITIRFLEFDGTNDGDNLDAAFWVGGTGTNVLFEDVEVHNYLWSGFNPTTNANFTTLRRVNAHYNALANPVQFGAGHGIYGQSKNLLIENSSFNDNGFPGSNSNGMQIYNSEAGIEADTAIIRNNRAQGNSAAGLVTDGVNVQVYNNLLTGNKVGIAHGYACPTGAKIYNNLIYNNSDDGIQLGIFASCTLSADISNNHIVGNGTTIEFFSRASNLGSNNRTTGTVTDCTVSQVNFHQKVGSSCIDAGLTLSIVTTDFEGVERPQGGAYDIGAYEGTGSDTQSPNIPVGLRIN